MHGPTPQPPVAGARGALLENLLTASSRLVRVAAQATGSSTPAAFWRTLSILASDGPMRNGDLARASRVSQPSMSKVQQSLVEDGLVERAADPGDSRAWLLAITPAGRTMLDGWKLTLAEALTPLFSDLTPEEANTLTAAVQIMHTRLNTNREVV